MNLRIILAFVAMWLLTAFLYGQWQYRVAWDLGRQKLVEQQRQQAQAKLAKQITRQQSDDTKAAAAESKGVANTVTITQEVIRYVKTPGRNVCVFDDTRVQLKSRAVDNANTIPGYDDAAVQTSAAVGQR